MLIRKIMCYEITVTLILVSNLLAISWPVSNTDQKHPQPQVAVNYGDWAMNEVPPFHAAIDIPAKGGTDGTTVRAINTGTVIARYESGYPTFPWYGLLFQEDGTGNIWAYTHLEEDFLVPVGTHVTEGQEIARIWYNFTIFPWPAGMDDHLHLVYCGTTGNRYNPTDNPLLQFAVGSIYRDPPDGTIWPWVWTQDLIENRAAIKNVYGKLWWIYPFWANKPIPKIYDYVDILAKAQDFMGGTLANGSEVNTGVYKLGFYISTKDKRVVLGEKSSPIIMHEFTGLLPSGDKFDAFFSKENPSSDWHDFFYIITNVEGDATNCWATKARSGGLSENDPRARIHSEAVYPDGDYIIWLMSWDAAGNTFGDGEAAYISVDNFMPFVHVVEIKQAASIKYYAHWPYIPLDDYNLGGLEINTDKSCFPGEALTFVIEFSEDMNTNVLPQLQVQLPNGPIKTVPTGSWLDNRIYQGEDGVRPGN